MCIIYCYERVRLTCARNHLHHARDRLFFCRNHRHSVLSFIERPSRYRQKKKTSKCLLLYNLYDPYTVIYFSAVHPVVGRGGGVRLQGRVEKQNHIYIYTNIIGAQKVDICLNAAVVVVRHYEHLYLYNIISYNQVPTTPGHKTMLVII